MDELEQLPTGQLEEDFWEEHSETLQVSEDAYTLLPAFSSEIFDREKQDKLRRLLDSPELARATQRWERWRSEPAQPRPRGAAA